MSIPLRIGNYTILRQLGAGGMAQIFEARDVQSGLIVALKLQTDTSISVEDLRRFRREADVLRNLAHPNIITMYAADSDNGRPYIAFELIQGGSIEHALQQHGAFPPKEAMKNRSISLRRFLRRVGILPAITRLCWLVRDRMKGV